MIKIKISQSKKKQQGLDYLYTCPMGARHKIAYHLLSVHPSLGARGQPHAWGQPCTRHGGCVGLAQCAPRWAHEASPTCTRQSVRGPTLMGTQKLAPMAICTPWRVCQTSHAHQGGCIVLTLCMPRVTIETQGYVVICHKCFAIILGESVITPYFYHNVRFEAPLWRK